jgi:4-hydroxy-3-methylbut-2-enyl diphosphate reductase
MGNKRYDKPMSQDPSKFSPERFRRGETSAFQSAMVDRARREGHRLVLSGGEIQLPEVFGFCRGVERALEMLESAVIEHRSRNSRLFLLGEIIHNPWVNEYFEQRGVCILSPQQREHPEQFIRPNDCAVVPAFGVPPEIYRRLEAIGCEIVDTSCGDVRRLWKWASQAAEEGFGVLIFGRARHDETVVTKQLLDEQGGKYLVVGDLDELREFTCLITGELPAENFRRRFSSEKTNTDTLDPMLRLAQVSQTTMLYDDTMQVRDVLRAAFEKRFGKEQVNEHLLLQPTVCRATQARQSAAVSLCRQGCDLTIVVGGIGSSNTRHLYELAKTYCPTYFIESAETMISAEKLETYDFELNAPRMVENWLPKRRPLRIGLLAGASSPEIVVGQVMEKLSEYLS